jgi:hypothetical protein
MGKARNPALFLHQPGMKRSADSPVTLAVAGTPRGCLK